MLVCTALTTAVNCPGRPRKSMASTRHPLSWALARSPMLVVAGAGSPATVYYRQSVSAADFRPRAIRVTSAVYAKSRASPAHQGSGKYPVDGA